MKKSSKRALSAILCLVILASIIIGTLPAISMAAGTKVLVVMGSDFQDPKTSYSSQGANGYGDQQARIETIMGNITDYYSDVTPVGFIAGGDYQYDSASSNNTTNTTRTNTGTNYVKQSVTKELGNVDMVFVEGNHDSMGTDIAASGNNDTDYYGVFVINEDNYESKQSSSTNTAAIATQLNTYLAAKSAEGYTKPIFVVSHVPLHYSTRTAKEKDAQFAYRLFNVLNDYEDLNIFFIFGHDHAWSDDDYLGGGSVYLEPGDTMQIAGSSVNATTGDVVPYSTETSNYQHQTTATLNFYYMNYGYTGYYWSSWSNRNYNGGNADPTLTMTSFVIEDDKVTIARWDEDGMHDKLKAAGAASPGLRPQAEVCTVTTNTYDPPRTVMLKGVTPSEDPTEPSTEATEAPSTEAPDPSEPSEPTEPDPTEPTEPTEPEEPEIVYEDLDWTAIPGDPGGWIQDTKLADLEDGDEVIIENYNAVAYVTNTASGTHLSFATTEGNATVWTVEKDGSTYYLKDSNGKYLTFANETAAVTDTPTPLTITTTTRNGDVVYDIARSVQTQSTTSVSYANRNSSTYINGNYYYNGNDGKPHVVTKLACTRSGQSWNYKYAWTITLDNGDQMSATSSSVSLITYSDTTYHLARYKQNYGTTTYAYANTSTASGAANNAWYFYEHEAAEPPVYVTMTGEDLEYWIGTMTAAQVESAVRDAVHVYFAEDNDGEPDYNTVRELGDSEISIVPVGSINPDTVGSVTFNVSYGDTALGSVTVDFVKPVITNVVSAATYGEVTEGATATAQPGGNLVVTLEDGSSKLVPIQLYMLEGDFDTNTPGTYRGLSITYEGFTMQAGNYTLVVNEKVYNDYPEYPDEGSVRVGKKGDTSENAWFETGVAEIELSATGIPLTPGVDIIFMLDTSSSMTKNKVDNGPTRMDVMQESLKDMMDQINGLSGSESIRIAIADFNGYGQINTNDKITSSVQSATNVAKIYTGPNAGQQTSVTGLDALDETAFVAPSQITDAMIDAITASSGTNYDYAFDATYRLGSAIREYNAANDQADRPLYVVFMSDGAAFQYNYYMTNSTFQHQLNQTGGPTTEWNAWLLGCFDADNTTSPWSSSPHKNFYYPALAADGVTTIQKHWMAEAIKGSQLEMFQVIDPTMSMGTGDDGDYFRTVPGLGATMYTVGFCLADDQANANQGVKKDVMEHNIKYLASMTASGDYRYQAADNAEELNAVFTSIFSDIKYAATKAYFLDQLGDDFKLQTASYVTRASDSDEISLAKAPTVQVQRYVLYTSDDVGKSVGGVTVTEDMVGLRTTATPKEVLETVSFNAAGTQAFSDKISGGTENILIDGVINANTFWYNNTDEAKTVTLEDGSTYQLPANSFYWKIGTLNDTELVLDYYVYLRDSMEDTRDPGSYATNNYAELHYTNYVDRPCVKTVPTPRLPWLNATVSYGFYLVDKDTGLPVVNQSTGQTGSFTNAVRLTDPKVYSEIPLNATSTDITVGVKALDVLPEGYTLYDPTAAYSVIINSDFTGSWTVTKGKTVATTYVTDYGGNPSTAVNMSASADYTHTTVWFAVEYEVAPVPDVVVIDYGLYVDIHVLANDMFGIYGTLCGVGEERPEGEEAATLDDSFGKTYELPHGTATYTGSVVRYTPKDMQMTEPEVFSYAVRYEKEGVATKYFYSTVTVVPAANMYFEQSFVQFEGDWENVGTADNKGQSEDRPGKEALEAYDANNFYGYDPTYNAYTTYSYGIAKKVTVSAEYYETNGAWPTAQFTFSGTGFDLISRTTSLDGFITVEVYDGTDTSGTPDYSWAVDNYFGYTASTNSEKPWVKITYTYSAKDGIWKTEGEYVAEKGSDGVDSLRPLPEEPNDGDSFICYFANYDWTPMNPGDSLYQIPVIRSPRLSEGLHTVVVTPRYSHVLDHKDAGQYDFIFDAVRTYEPAQNLDATFYQLDREGWPQFIHVRKNLIAQDAFVTDGTIVNGAAVNGAVFIDGFNTSGDISEYTNFGPNNEVYLKQNQAVAFRLEAKNASKIDTVQIGLKTVEGTSANAVITGLTEAAPAEKIRKLATATEMFYDMTDVVSWDGNDSNILVVKNTEASILIITNVKLTYKSDPEEATKMKMRYSDAMLAAEYVQGSIIEELKACTHVYSAHVTKLPTSACSGEAQIYCSRCNFHDTVTLPMLTDAAYTSTLDKVPTCSRAGQQTYTLTDSTYGDIKVRIPIHALGHDYIEPIYDVTGIVTWTCAVCGDTFSTEIDVLPDEEASAMKVKSAALKLDENINVVFNADIPEGLEHAFVEFTLNGETVTVLDDGSHEFVFEDIAPQFMGDTIEAVLHGFVNGTEYTATRTYSIRQYCVNQLERYADNEALCTLLTDLLIYGEAAQVYTGYKLDELVTNGLELTVSDYAPISDYPMSIDGIADADCDWTSAALILKNDMAIRFSFAAENVEGLIIRVSIDGRTEEFLPEQFIDLGSGRYCVDFTGILATEFGQSVTAEFFRNGEKIGRTLNYSVYAYISKMQNKEMNNEFAELLKAIYAYGESARNYAEQSNGKVA